MSGIRLSTDIQVTKGDPARVEKILMKKEVRQELADFIAHVLVVNSAGETAEAAPLGGYVHQHTTAGGPCSTCKSEASVEVLPDFD